MEEELLDKISLILFSPTSSPITIAVLAALLISSILGLACIYCRGKRRKPAAAARGALSEELLAQSTLGGSTFTCSSVIGPSLGRGHSSTISSLGRGHSTISSSSAASEASSATESTSTISALDISMSLGGMKEIMHPIWLDVNPLQETESSTASITDFGRKDFNGKFTGTVIGRSVGTGMDFDPPSRETGTGTGSLLGWSIDNGIDTDFVKHFKDCGTGTDTDRKDQGIGTNTSTSSDSANKVQDMATGTANLAGFLPPIKETESGVLPPISESESEPSLIGLPFKPRTFDDNLV